MLKFQKILLLSLVAKQLKCLWNVWRLIHLFLDLILGVF